MVHRHSFPNPTPSPASIPHVSAKSPKSMEESEKSLTGWGQRGRVDWGLCDLRARVAWKPACFVVFFAPCFTFKTCFDPKHIHQANPVSLAMQESVWSWPLGHHKKISFFAEPKCEYQNISMKACKEHKSLTLGPTTSFFFVGPTFPYVWHSVQRPQIFKFVPHQKLYFFWCRAKVWLLLIRRANTIFNL